MRRSMTLVLLLCSYFFALVLFLPKVLSLPLLGLALYLGTILLFRTMGQLE